MKDVPLKNFHKVITSNAHSEIWTLRASKWTMKKKREKVKDD